ncbi:unnamed protein product [Rhizophagus irregularis]|nr:unnamed protein product [Rhizophagus irregularis]
MSEPTNIFKKVFKKISNRNNRNAGTENFSEESQSIIKQWKKIVKQKHKKDKNNEDVDTYYEDPLLLIEWDTMGIAARAMANPANTNLIISNLIRAQQGYTQFPPLPGLPSDCAFSFDNAGGFQPHQNLINAIAAVGAYLNSPNGIWAKHTPLIPDLGRVYQIEVPRKGEFHVTEHTLLFNV